MVNPNASYDLEERKRIAKLSTGIIK